MSRISPLDFALNLFLGGIVNVMNKHIGESNFQSLANRLHRYPGAFLGVLQRWGTTQLHQAGNALRHLISAFVLTSEVGVISTWFSNDTSDGDWFEEFTDIGIILFGAFVAGTINAIGADGSLDIGVVKIGGITIPSDIIVNVAVNTMITAVSVGVDESVQSE